jgi:uncharacterized protein (TIGR03790 family)
MQRLSVRTAVHVVMTAAVLLLPPAAHAQSARNVAVVINDNSSDSQNVGDYYVRRRGIPPSNVIRIKTSLEETIDRNVYLTSIESPIAEALGARRLQDRVLYIVLTKGIPLKVDGDGGPQGTTASVDSELTLLYRRLTGVRTEVRGSVANPYYLADGAREVKPFTHRDFDMYLVTRLDGFTVDDVIGLIERGSAPVQTGRIVLDGQGEVGNRLGEDWLDEAARRLKLSGQGDRTFIERTTKGVRDVKPVMGYYSWGSNDSNNRERSFNLGFVAGSIGGMFVSSDARTFKPPPAAWVPGDWADPTRLFVGTAQSLIGDLIHQGITGVSGHVTEPYLENTVRPEILFPAYLAGLNLAEAFYLAMPSLSWRNVIIGDPLCAPFRKRKLTEDDLDPGLEERTGLPRFFSARRVTSLRSQMPGLSEDLLQLTAKGLALSATGDGSTARQALEEVTRVAPQATAAQVQLAIFDGADQKFDSAIERYRYVVAEQPRNGIALNNLAYTLAVQRNAPAEALPLAERALAALPQNADILDTVAWIEHLLGRHEAAVQHIADAVRSAPGSADFHLHAAIINAAAGDGVIGEQELQLALRLQPSLQESPDVTELRTRLHQLAVPSP